MPESGRQLAAAVRGDRLTVPTTAIGAAPVGRALESQLRCVADDLEGHLVEDCGHIVPVDRPDALLALLRPALRVTDRGGRADVPRPPGSAPR